VDVCLGQADIHRVTGASRVKFLAWAGGVSGAKHQRVAEATVIAPTPPDHGDVCLAECALAHQLTLISRWIEQGSDVGFGQLLSAHHPYLLGRRPAEQPNRARESTNVLDASEDAVLVAPSSGGARHVYLPVLTGFPLPAVVFSVCPLMLQKIGRSLVPAL
jgi:hypothetical protein